MKLFSKKTKKALIIGIDGVPYSLLNTYTRNGVMPNLKRILSQGFTLHQMNASIPDISSVSWTSFATGVNPGEHGIYGFTDLRPQSYSLYFPNSKDRKAPTFWEVLGKTANTTSSLSRQYLPKMNRSFRSIVLNMPHTYPAYPMNGILVSGFVAVDLKRAIYPDSAFTYLDQMGYLIDVEAEKAREDKAAFMKSLFECFEVRKKAIAHFFTQESWDLFFACVTETDRLHHFFFDASTDKENPCSQPFLRFYAELDQWIQTLYNDFFHLSDGKGFFMILSDHGFAPIKKEVYINQFLKERGLLFLKDEGDFYERIENRTTAFNLDPCRIYIHDKMAYPNGRIRREEKAEVLTKIKEALKSLKEDGNPIIGQIYHKEEIYHGPQMERAPDLVCLPTEGYDLKGSLERGQIFSDTPFKGMHTWHDACCVLPDTITISKKLSVENLADYILQYFS
jgi:predicted AlkP superfamily phosphohydrolase/phosphomutase